MEIHFVIPYRDRLAHWVQFYPHIVAHSKGRYTPYFWVAEQSEGRPFNRGALLNLGTLAVKAEFGPEARIVLHDIDMLPSSHVNYCAMEADFVHLATSCTQFKNQMPYRDYFGGVVMTTVSKMESVGGFPNNFWGWGGEDDALLIRVRYRDFEEVHRPNTHFHSLSHDRTIDTGLLTNNRELLEQERRKPCIAYGIEHVQKEWNCEPVPTDLHGVRWLACSPK